MVDPLNDHQAILARQRGHQLFNLPHVAVFIIAAMYEQLRLAAFEQKGNVSVIHRLTQN